jgi:DNA-binding SARP family transcriptional activator
MEQHSGRADPACSASRDASRMIRISIFGPLTIEWEGQATPFPAERLLGRGAAPALSLLKALLCQPHRFALRDWLMEQFWPNTTRSRAEERLDDVASGLRTLLRPPESQAKILHYVYGGPGSGSGYRLEGYPYIWVDADAFVWNVEQAARMERFGDDPLPLWERAYELAKRGTFLPEEVYSDWAKEWREVLEGHYRQCVHRLAHVLRERGAHEEALLRLRTYWQAHSADEDALRPLMECLGEQERYQEAEACYQQFLGTLEQEGPGRQPDPRTQDMREYLHTKQIYRKQKKSISSEIATPQNIVTSRNIPVFSSLSAIQHTYHATGIPSSPSQEYGVQTRHDGQKEQVGVCLPARGQNNIHTLESGIAHMKEARRHLLQRMLRMPSRKLWKGKRVKERRLYNSLCKWSETEQLTSKKIRHQPTIPSGVLSRYPPFPKRANREIPRCST